MKPFYIFGYILSKLTFRLIFHIKVIGKENVPLKDSLIIASNHLALIDPFIVGSVFKCEIYYFAKIELFSQFIIKDIIKKWNALPIRRDKVDLSAFKACMLVLRKKRMPLLIFPEGTRIKTGKLGKPKKGIAHLLSQTKVPVLPVYIENSNFLFDCAFFKKRLIINIGKPVFYPEYKTYCTEKEKYGDLAKLIMDKIQELKDQVRQVGPHD